MHVQHPPVCATGPMLKRLSHISYVPFHLLCEYWQFWRQIYRMYGTASDHITKNTAMLITQNLSPTNICHLKMIFSAPSRRMILDSITEEYQPKSPSVEAANDTGTAQLFPCYLPPPPMELSPAIRKYEVFKTYWAKGNRIIFARFS